jgi:hypothetical protein
VEPDTGEVCLSRKSALLAPCLFGDARVPWQFGAEAVELFAMAHREEAVSR